MPTWRASSRSGAIRNTDGAELITNGTMEADANWGNVGTPSTNERSTTQVHGGTYSRKFVTDAANEGIQGDVYATTTGVLYRYEVNTYSTAASISAHVNIRKGDNSGLLLNGLLVLGLNMWTQQVSYITETAGGAGAYLQVTAPSGFTVYVDDVSVIPLTPSLG